MTGTQLDPMLRNLGVTTIVGVGVSVNIGMTNFVFDAVNRGYQFVMPTDAVAGVPDDYAAAVVANTLALVATLTTTDAVLGAWRCAVIVPDGKDWTWVLERRCDDCGFDATAFPVTETGHGPEQRRGLGGRCSSATTSPCGPARTAGRCSSTRATYATSSASTTSASRACWTRTGRTTTTGTRTRPRRLEAYHAQDPAIVGPELVAAAEVGRGALRRRARRPVAAHRLPGRRRGVHGGVVRAVLRARPRPPSLGRREPDQAARWPSWISSSVRPLVSGTRDRTNRIDAEPDHGVEREGPRVAEQVDQAEERQRHHEVADPVDGGGHRVAGTRVPRREDLG